MSGWGAFKYTYLLNFSRGVSVSLLRAAFDAFRSDVITGAPPLNTFLGKYSVVLRKNLRALPNVIG